MDITEEKRKNNATVVIEIITSLMADPGLVLCLRVLLIVAIEIAGNQRGTRRR